MITPSTGIRFPDRPASSKSQTDSAVSFHIRFPCYYSLLFRVVRCNVLRFLTLKSVNCKINAIHGHYTYFDLLIVNTGCWLQHTSDPSHDPRLLCMRFIVRVCKSNGWCVVLHTVTCQMKILLMPVGTNVLRNNGKSSQ